MGDSFINEIYKDLQNLKKTPSTKNKRQPYMYDQYNVKIFSAYPLSLTKNTVGRFINVFIKALSDAKKIPSIVLLFPDWDILQFLDFYQDGAHAMTSCILNWIVVSITRAIQSKKDSFSHRNPGSVSENEPKLMWIKMINRHGEFDRALMTQARFNRALEDVLVDKKQQHIMDVNQAVDSPNYFGPQNMLNGDGMTRYWYEVDKNVKLFDADPKLFRPKCMYYSDLKSNNRDRADHHEHNNYARNKMHCRPDNKYFWQRTKDHY